MLGLSVTQLTGTLPAELGNLGKLKYLNLHENQLTGSIPANFGNLISLESISLNDNQLSGIIPLSVAQLGGLIQQVQGTYGCKFLPGNGGLSLPDTQDYRDADLDGDGYICLVPFPPAPFPMPILW